MNSLYAICPFCNKSVFIEENASGGYSCPHCSQALGLSYLQENNLIIDTEAAKETYDLAYRAFEHSDYHTAESLFLQVLGFNRNHYLAEYYSRLCEIYSNEGKPDFNAPGKMVETVKIAVDKTYLAQIGLEERIDFVSTALKHTYALFSARFNDIYEKYEKREMWDILRDKCLGLAVSIKELTDIDKELLTVFEGAISKLLVQIADLAICACQKIVQPHLVSATVIDLPTDFEYEKAKSLYSHLFYYAHSLDPEYEFSSYKPDYTANLLYNEKVIEKLNRYDSENKIAQKSSLSTPGQTLNSFRSDAAVAIKYSYHTCFKGLYIPKGEQARTTLVNESISFCFELLMPRLYVYEKKIYVDAKNCSKAREISYYLNEFLIDFDSYNNKLTADYVSKFFRSVYDTVKAYYALVYSTYNKSIDDLKKRLDDEYEYYKNFLHNVMYACAVSLSEIVPYDDKRTVGDRLKVLRLGKTVAEEFLLLCDYKIDDLEQSAQYSDVLDMFNAFENDIETFSRR